MMIGEPDWYQVFVCHSEESTDSPERGALWREFAPDVKNVVMMQLLEWCRQGGSPHSEQRGVRFLTGSAEYIIDLGALKQKRMDVTQGATRRIKIVMPVTKDMITKDTIPVGHELQFSIMHKPAKTHIPDCGALWIPYKPNVNSKVVDKFRQWVRQGANRDDPGKNDNITVGETNYIVDFAAMTQTRIIKDWRTNGESWGSTRKLRVDAILKEG